MVKFLSDDQLEEVRDQERREYFRYINKLRRHQKNMKIAFTITVICFVLIISGILLYGHYNNQTLILVLVSPSEPTTEEAAKKILIKDFNKLEFNENSQFKILVTDLYNNKYGVKIDKIYQNSELCDGYVLITKTDKYYQIDTTNYCKK